ncbi:acylphosphatase [Hymenobacter sp. HSC-4F20]|uniref:acylphosphatase n=1 Tax=Hymenobacter sp. HSC-4F20 TaxID=2864135 RepID=UPI001C731DD0|nr:acylphosphatase [Hymenobacter sp. HSC-4F20]MBX0292221.1 acylphosphatase [Hymenobacter sp. HSC-4F20]
MSIEHRTFLVRGHVQGVFYRQSTQQEARRLGLVGTVRNNPDGTVVIEAEGPAEVLDALEAWCRQGPPAAQVEQVQASRGAVQGYREFVVQR